MSSNLQRWSGALALIALSCCAITSAQAPNDHCTGAIVAVNGVTTGNNGNASVGPDPMPACGTMSNDVWYLYTATCTGLVTASTCGTGTNFDTIIAAWSGGCGCLSELACNDDACPGNKSSITWPAFAGTSYYISVGGFDGGVGGFALNISCAQLNPPPIIPANDHCSTATFIVEGALTSGTTIQATSGGGGPCPGDPTGSCSVMANDVWYSFQAACTGTYEARTCFPGTNFDTVVAIWDGTGGCGSLVEVACNDTGSCALPGLGNAATATWQATAGTLYYVSVGGFIGLTGNFSLMVSQTGANPVLSFFSVAPGSIGYTVAGGPPSGVALTAITVNQGAFPNGPFFGVDMTLAEVIDELNFGYPFFVNLGFCGEATVGPFFGAPSGLNLYAVTVTALAGTQVVHSTSVAVTAQVP